MAKATSGEPRQETEGRQEQSLKFRRQFDKNYKGYPGEINNEPSQTQPDMSLTVKELLDNHSRGIGMSVKEYPQNYMETEIPKITDLTDVETLVQKNQREKNELEDTLRAKKEQYDLDQVKKEKTPEKTPEPPKKDNEAEPIP